MQLVEEDALAAELAFFTSAIRRADAAGLADFVAVQNARTELAAKMSEAAEVAKAFLASLRALLA